MGRCEYVDESANFLDGWHCIIIGGHVDDHRIVNNYCRDSVHCKDCPYRNPGKSRRADPEPKPEPVREDRSRNYYDAEYRTTPLPSSRPSAKGSYGGNVDYSFRATVIFCAGVFLLGIFMMVMEILGFYRSTINFAMSFPAYVDPGDVQIRVITYDPEKLYESKTKSFGDDGTLSMYINNGKNDVYWEYDGVCFFIDSAYGDSENDFSNGTKFSYIESQMFRPLLVTLRDVWGNPIVSPDITAANNNGDTWEIIKIADDEYAIMLTYLDITAELTITIPGYLPLHVNADMSDRVARMVLTFEQLPTATGGNP